MTSPLDSIIEEAARAMMVPDISGKPSDYWLNKSQAALSVFIKRVLREPSEDMLGTMNAPLFEAFGSHPLTQHEGTEILRAIADYLEGKK